MIHKKNQRLSIKQKNTTTLRIQMLARNIATTRIKIEQVIPLLQSHIIGQKKDCSYTITNMKWTFRRARVKQRINYKHD